MALKLPWYEPPRKVIDMREHFSLEQQANRAARIINEARAALKPIPVLAAIPNFAISPIVFPEVVPVDDPELDAIIKEERRVDEMLDQIEQKFPWIEGADDGERKI